MPRVSDAHREHRREQIAAAALRCFLRSGFHRTSMADIIAEAGLSAGAIYLHFPGKREIALAAARSVLDRRTAQIDALSDSGAPLAPAALVRRLVGELAEEIGDTRIIVQLWGEATTDADMRDLVSEVFGELRGSFVHYLESWAMHDRGVDAAAARAWAQTVVPALLAWGQGFMIQRALFPDFDADAYFASIDAIAAPPSG